MNRRDELLAVEDAGWHHLSAELGRISDPDWLRPGVNGEWNVKDLVAHIALWHASATDRIEAYRMSGTLPPLPGDIDVINKEQYERCRDLTLKEARAMSGASRHRFREEVGLLPTEPGDKLSLLIIGDGSEHYDEHIPQLRAFMGDR